MTTYYVVTLDPSASPIIQALALMACRSNNRKQSSKLTLSEFKEYFDLHYRNDDQVKCEISHNFVSIDKKQSGSWRNVIFIQEVDIVEPAAEEDEEDGY